MFGFLMLMLSIQSVQNLIFSLINNPKVRDSISVGIILIHLNDVILPFNSRAWTNDLSVGSFSVHRHFLARVHVAWLNYILALLRIVYVINRFRIWIELFLYLLVIFSKQYIKFRREMLFGFVIMNDRI